MRIEFKHILKDFVPPVVLRAYERVVLKYGFFGNYPSWEEAKKVSVGYGSKIILNRVKDATLKVKEGEAVFERDSVLFDKVEYSFPLLAWLLRIAVSNGNRLSVLDFGGSLGSTYFQCWSFLEDIKELKWNIVEQEHFVSCGKKNFQNEQLKFYSSIEECLQYENPHVIIFSGVIQYLECPFTILQNTVDQGFEYIIFDRTPFLLYGTTDRITVQKVSPQIYDASYPAWFFNRENFLNFFSGTYKLIIEFDALDKASIPSKYKGFIFKKAN